MHDEVDTRSLGVIVCLHRAGVGALIVYVHVVYLDAVLGLGVGQDDHTVVYRPLVIAGIQDGAAVQPRHPRHPVIHSTPAGTHRPSHTWNSTHREHPGSQKGMGAGWECGSHNMEMLHAVAVLPVSTSPHHVRFHINSGFARNKTSLFLLHTTGEPHTKFPLFDLCKPSRPSPSPFSPTSTAPLAFAVH